MRGTPGKKEESFRFLAEAVERFTAEMHARNWSEHTVIGYRYRLTWFADYLAAHHPNVPTIAEVTRDVIFAFQHWMCQRETNRGTPFSPSSQRSTLAAVKSFFDICTVERIVVLDPTRTTELPKVGRRLPRGVLSSKEMRACFDNRTSTRAPACAIARSSKRFTRLACATPSCAG